MERIACWSVGAALLIALWAQMAVAQEAPLEPDEREVSARQLFAVGKYGEALEIYGKLFGETAHPTYLRNIGRCYQNLSEPDKAISSFREYLRQAKDLPADQRTLVERYIREMEDLKRRPASERPANADAGAASPTHPGGPSALISATPSSGGAAAGSAAHRSRTAAYVVVGASVAALGVGTFFGLSALSNKRAADPLCPMDKCTTDGWNDNEAAVRDALITDIALGVGIVGAGVAGYLFFRSSKGGPPPPEPTARLRILPKLATRLAGVSAEVRW